ALIQMPGPCTYALFPTNSPLGPGSVTGTVSVVTPGSCPWAVSNGNSWVTILSGSNGSGSGVVTYATAARTSSSSRTGSLRIGGQLLAISQLGRSGCTFALTPTNRVHGYGSENGAFTVTALDGCAWTVTNSTSWITILTSTNGGGTATVLYAISNNPA